MRLDSLIYFFNILNSSTDEHTGKSVKVSKKGEKYDKKITDFELNLRLTVNMATEEIEKVEVFDKFTVNVTYSYFPDGEVVFEKK